MPSPEQSRNNSPAEQPKQQIEISITPQEDSGIVFQRDADQALILGGKGEFAIRLQLPGMPNPLKEELATQLPQEPETLPLPDSAKGEAAQSPVNAPDGRTSSSLPDSTPAAATAQHSTSETVSNNQPTQAEDERNRRHQFKGYVASSPYYRERKTGTQIADFVLAEHPESDQTVYRRIRAFGTQAEKVRNRMAKGQEVEVTAYGPKHWTDSVKKEGRWTKAERQGYYAGFVKVPRDEPKS